MDLIFIVKCLILFLFFLQCLKFFLAEVLPSWLGLFLSIFISYCEWDFLLSFWAGLLLVYRKATYFCVNFVYCYITERPKSFLVVFIGTFKEGIVSFVNRCNFTSPFLICNSFLFLDLDVLSKILNTLLNSYSTMLISFHSLDKMLSDFPHLLQHCLIGCYI